MKTAMLVLGMSLASTAQATEWACGDDIHLNTDGSIVMGGTKIEAHYELHGLTHLWNWGPNGNYQVELNPDGLMVYRDFTAAKEGEPRKRSSVVSCKKAK